jgi:tRNA (guanine37-N1)-methyltransferase
VSAPRLAFHVVTLFPEMIASCSAVGVVGKALAAGVLAVRAHQLRDWSGGSIHPLDDHPYGGGPGMVMRPEPVYAAVEELTAAHAPERKILLTPQGRPFDQASARRLAAHRSLLLFCGRYEGVDERVRPLFDEELTIGDYVLTGGEPAALVVIDAVGRLVSGVVGRAESLDAESFTAGLLEYPQYTRPEEFRGMRVPPVLLSGNHAAIERWRREQALERTRLRRPDLLDRGRTGSPPASSDVDGED